MYNLEKLFREKLSWCLTVVLLMLSFSLIKILFFSRKEELLLVEKPLKLVRIKYVQKSA